jgi:hypothetical protein
VIEKIKRLVIRSAEVVSNEKLSRGEPAIAATTVAAKQRSRWTTPKNCLGSRWISTTVLGSS